MAEVGSDLWMPSAPEAESPTVFAQHNTQVASEHLQGLHSLPAQPVPELITDQQLVSDSTAVLARYLHVFGERQLCIEKLVKSVCRMFFFSYFLYLLAYTAKLLQQNTFQDQLLILTGKAAGFPKDSLVILTARSFLKSSVSGSSRSSRKLYSGSSSSSNSSNRKYVVTCQDSAPGPNQGVQHVLQNQTTAAAKITNNRRKKQSRRRREKPQAPSVPQHAVHTFILHIIVHEPSKPPLPLLIICSVGIVHVRCDIWGSELSLQLTKGNVLQGSLGSGSEGNEAVFQRLKS